MTSRLKERIRVRMRLFKYSRYAPVQCGRLNSLKKIKGKFAEVLPYRGDALDLAAYTNDGRRYNVGAGCTRLRKVQSVY